MRSEECRVKKSKPHEDTKKSVYKPFFALIKALYALPWPFNQNSAIRNLSAVPCLRAMHRQACTAQAGQKSLYFRAC